MCSRPITKDGMTFACRTCDACIATRRLAWVARAMMEKALHPHALCLALTYDDSTPENRDSARMFCYADVAAFLKRLRRAAEYLFPGAKLRFICAGEQGDRNGRCHWHIVIFGNFDLTKVGVFSSVSGPVSEREKMVSKGKQMRRLNWSIWGRGFVTLQEPDEGAMHYVLSYCLKDQFTQEKSRNTMREARSENFATGLFRMSKRPAIGEAWLWQKWEKLEASGDVLPSLNLKVPGLSGFFHPSGSFREKMLWSLRALNQRAILTTGRDAPQWSSLLASLQDFPSDLEILLGPSIQQKADAESLAFELAKRQREHSGFHARKEFARTCGAELPCSACLERLDDNTQRKLGVSSYIYRGQTYFESLDGFDPVTTRQARAGQGSNPYCQKRGSILSRHTFPSSDQTKLRRGNV